MRLSFLCACSVIFVFACGGDSGSDGGGSGNTLARCDTAGDCSDGYVCLHGGGGNYCAPICTGSVDECGAEATCGGVGVMDVDVCKPKPDPQSPPDAEEEPRIPCRTDAECAQLHPGAICAQFQGHKDCTLPCTVESQCDAPAIGGVSFDFLQCAPDEGNTSRKACLPDPACFNNPMACISGFPGGF